MNGARRRNTPNLEKNEMLRAWIVQNLAGRLTLVASSKLYHLAEARRSHQFLLPSSLQYGNRLISWGNVCVKAYKGRSIR